VVAADKTSVNQTQAAAQHSKVEANISKVNMTDKQDILDAAVIDA